MGTACSVQCIKDTFESSVSPLVDLRKLSQARLVRPSAAVARASKSKYCHTLPKIMMAKLFHPGARMSLSLSADYSIPTGVVGESTAHQLNASVSTIKCPHLYEIMKHSGGIGSMIIPAMGSQNFEDGGGGGIANAFKGQTHNYQSGFGYLTVDNYPNSDYSVEREPVIIVFIFGGPGSYKSEIISNLLDMFGYHYISANDIILEYLLTNLDNHLLPSELREYAENYRSLFSLPQTLAIVKDIIDNIILKLQQSSSTPSSTKYRNSGKFGMGIDNRKVPITPGFLIDIMPCVKFLPSGSDYFVDPGPDLKIFETTHPINFAISLNIGANKITSFVSEYKAVKKMRPSLSSKMKLKKEKEKTSGSYNPKDTDNDKINKMRDATVGAQKSKDGILAPKVPVSMLGKKLPEIKVPEKVGDNSGDDENGDDIAQVSDEEEKCRLKRRIFKYHQNSEDFLEYFRSTSRLIQFDVSHHDYSIVWRRVRRFFVTYFEATTTNALQSKSSQNRNKNLFSSRNAMHASPTTSTKLQPSLKNTQQCHLVFNFKSWTLKDVTCYRLNIKQVKLNVLYGARSLAPDKELIELCHYISKNCINTQEVFLIECHKSSLVNIPEFSKKIQKSIQKSSKTLLFLEHDSTPIKLSDIVFKALHGLGGSGKKQVIAHLISMHKRALNIKFFSVKASQNVTCYYQLGTIPQVYQWITQQIGSEIKKMISEPINNYSITRQ